MSKTSTALNDFATSLYKKVAAAEPGKNLFLSPFSIEVALAMTAVGAKGETRRVMADLIRAPESVDDQNRHYARLLKSIHGDGKRPFQLATANALWGQQSFHFKPEFQEAIADCYDGALHVVNFRKPNEAVKTINSWVSDKTAGRIKELIHRNLMNPDTLLILTNAIYFKGQWEREFDKGDTRDENWHGKDGACMVPMMHQRGGYLYCESIDFQALDLPYKGRQLSMLVVLPRKKDGLAALEIEFATNGAYRRVTESLDHEDSVIVSFPRFKLESEFRLRPVLCGLHAELAFSAEADFSGIADEPLMISEVVHKAFVDVNEEGTEAAAATAVMMVRSTGLGGPAQEPKVFKADHPFLFFIRDRKSNAVLFSGRVVDPK